MDWSLPVGLLILGLGLAAGLIAGFVGVGGGIIMVPVLLEIFRRWGLPAEAVVQAAMGTSLTVAVFSVTSGMVRHARQGRIFWKLVPFLAPGCLAGGWLAARLATRLPGQYLQLGLASVMTLAAIRLFAREPYRARSESRISWWRGGLVGLGVGLVAGLTGLAGGIVLVPALALILGLRSGWLAGTSSAVIVFSALSAALGYLTAQPPADLGPGFTGYACLPVAALLAAGAIPAAQVGAWLNRRTKSIVFRRLFAVLMVFAAIRMVFRALG